MALTTAFTRTLAVEHPIVQAPMGGSAGGALAAAVSEGGGLGMVGGGRGDRHFLDREVEALRSRTSQPWGIGFLTWAVTSTIVARALECGPHALMLSFGDPTPFASLVRDAGCALIVQATDLDEARRAIDVGADVVVAQGGEAGGHGGQRATLPFVPAVVDLAGDLPVLAAGGIADGRGVAAALSLGAAGALVGTRFQASLEALVAPEITKVLVEATGESTERTRVLDLANRAGWPSTYSARVVRNAFLDRWREHEEEITHDHAAQDAYREAVSRHDISAVSIWAGEALDLITDLRSARDLVTDLAEGAEQALHAALER